MPSQASNRTSVELKNYFPLSICKRHGQYPAARHKRISKAAVTAFPILLINKATQAYLGKTSITVSKYCVPRFQLFMGCISTRLATHCSPMWKARKGKVGNRLQTV